MPSCTGPGRGRPEGAKRSTTMRRASPTGRNCELESTMPTKTEGVTGAALKRAIEGRDGPTLARFYTDDAVLRIIDRNNPPSRPREVKGRSAISTFWDD